MIERAVLQGLMKAVFANMKGKPTAEDISGMTMRIYCEQLRVQGLDNDDAQRVTDAFETCIRNMEWFPSVKNVIDNLPAKEKPHALPAPRCSRESALQNLKRVDEMMTVKKNVDTKPGKILRNEDGTWRKEYEDGTVKNY